MKKFLGTGLVALALLAGCQAKSHTVAPISNPTPAPAADPFDKPPVMTATPGPAVPSDMGGTPTIPDTTPKVTVKPGSKTPHSSSGGTSKNTKAVAGGAKTYVVKKGDTLSKIAKAMYGNGKLYTKIVKANPGLDPNKIKVGQTIKIPA